jgi:hypothetical protein
MSYDYKIDKAVNEAGRKTNVSLGKLYGVGLGPGDPKLLTLLFLFPKPAKKKIP